MNKANVMCQKIESEQNLSVCLRFIRGSREGCVRIDCGIDRMY